MEIKIRKLRYSYNKSFASFWFPSPYPSRFSIVKNLGRILVADLIDVLTLKFLEEG